MQQRLAMILAAAVVGAIFIAGLFVHGRAGGGLLLVTDAILITLTSATWTRARPQGRPIRVAIIVAIAVVAIAKLVTG
jgi:hypothetical protein